MNDKFKRAVGIFFLIVALVPNVVYADTNDSWEYGISIYGWFPDLSGKTSLPDGSGGDFTVPISDILDNLQFTLQGSFDARKGHWGLFTDVIYMDVGKTEKVVDEGTIGGNDWPYDFTAKVGFDMKSLIWSAAGYRRMVDAPNMSFDLLAGLRYIDVKQSLDWSFSGNIGEFPLPGREGRAKVAGDSWDAIVGMRGRFSFGRDISWFIPYYLDMGLGDSDFTWQAVGGIGYAFNWGELAAAWRYLSYDQSAGKPLSDMEFSGPAVGAVFRW